jgi:flagellar hook protein FlgE
MTFTVPDGSVLTLDLSKSTELGAGFSIQDVNLNGHPASAAAGFQISEDGTVYAQYENGDLVPIYRLAMADVISPDQLKPLSGTSSKRLRILAGRMSDLPDRAALAKSLLARWRIPTSTSPES